MIRPSLADGRVKVQVDEAGQHRLVGRVNDAHPLEVVASPHVRRRANIDDAIIFDQQRPVFDQVVGVVHRQHRTVFDQKSCH